MGVCFIKVACTWPFSVKCPVYGSNVVWFQLNALFFVAYVTQMTMLNGFRWAYHSNELVTICVGLWVNHDLLISCLQICASAWHLHSSTFVRRSICVCRSNARLSPRHVFLLKWRNSWTHSYPTSHHSMHLKAVLPSSRNESLHSSSRRQSGRL